MFILLKVHTYKGLIILNILLIRKLPSRESHGSLFDVFPFRFISMRKPTATLYFLKKVKIPKLVAQKFYFMCRMTAYQFWYNLYFETQSYLAMNLHMVPYLGRYGRRVLVKYCRWTSSKLKSQDRCIGSWQTRPSLCDAHIGCRFEGSLFRIAGIRSSVVFTFLTYAGHWPKAKNKGRNSETNLLLQN